MLSYTTLLKKGLTDKFFETGMHFQLLNSPSSKPEVLELIALKTLIKTTGKHAVFAYAYLTVYRQHSDQL